MQNLALKSQERWFVVQVAAHRDNCALINLRLQGFRCFAPRIQRTVRHARQLRAVLAPLFLGYIFVIVDLSSHQWRSINGTFGVASLIMGAEQPMPVPSGVVEALVAACEGTGIVRLERDLNIGQRVRILTGPLADTLCRVVHLDDKGRVRVLLEIMGAEVLVRLSRSRLAAAE